MAARLVVLGVLAWSPVPQALGRVAAVVAQPPGAFATIVSLVLSAAVIVSLLELAAAAAGGLVRAADGRRAGPDSAHDPFVAGGDPRWRLGLPALATVLAAAVVLAAEALAGAWWWLASAVTLAGAGLGALAASPAVVGQLLGARPLVDAAIEARLAALARAAGVTVGAISEVASGDRPAFVAGLGRSRRIFLSSAALRDWRPEEIDVVVAHELGHHRRGDLWRSFLVDTAVVGAGFGLAGLAASAGRLAPPSAGVAVLPAIAWVVALVWVAATPLRHAQSRHHERQADAFALHLTGQADAFVTVIRRLGKIHFADEQPGALARWATARHPTVAERLRAAERFRDSGA